MKISRSFLWQLPVAFCMLLTATAILVALAAPRFDPNLAISVSRASASLAELSAE